MRRITIALALLLVFCLSGSSSALGQEEGVTLDPSAPAAKEYALPVEQARREASGEGDAPVAQGTRNAEPFGVGVTPDAEQGEQGTSNSGSGTGTSAGAAEPTSPSAAGSTDAPANAVTTTEASSATMGSTAVLLGGGLATLLVAGLGGLALRAVRGPADE